MSFNKNDDHYREIIANLLFIARIPANHKIDTQNLTLWEPTWITFLFRRWNGETCDDTLEFLNNNYDEALRLVEIYTERNEPSMVEDMIKCIKESEKGLDSLTKTYSDNTMFIAKLESLRMAINNKLKTYESK